MERKRRGCGEKLLVKGENTKKPADWRNFLTNYENKQQLVKIMCKSWESDENASKLEGMKFILVCEGEAFQFTTRDGETT
ncbi:hypothetical protein DPMN_088765 [Dreissena polymorpha]|uniref:Uncharacterized protein n=1 Tax=Dreissena polymorpha TaxID=45954 RepID=A0A9D4QWT3_DREPO|nr:hypothetical protein DPMN_088765 [Dreissena polymorpha]